ncbi:MAG: MltR family transcriptional regulator [Smithella sp.]|nr:MltR family transcriptional regulator [Smithella sp.]
MKRWKPVNLVELSGDTQKVFDVLNAESDLACVLIGTSYLSELLANIVEVSFIETSISGKLLDPQGGAVGQFATRADLAYCLGLINKGVYQDLARVAVIRNMFAHKHIALDFNDSTVKKLCGELRAWRILQDEEDELAEPSQDQLRMLARNQFNLSVILMGSRLHVDALGKREQRKKI